MLQFQVVDGQLFVAVPVAAGILAAYGVGIFGSNRIADLIMDTTQWSPLKQAVILAVSGGLLASAVEYGTKVAIGAILESANRGS